MQYVSGQCCRVCTVSQTVVVYEVDIPAET